MRPCQVKVSFRGLFLTQFVIRKSIVRRHCNVKVTLAFKGRWLTAVILKYTSQTSSLRGSPVIFRGIETIILVCGTVVLTNLNDVDSDLSLSWNTTSLLPPTKPISLNVANWKTKSALVSFSPRTLVFASFKTSIEAISQVFLKTLVLCCGWLQPFSCTVVVCKVRTKKLDCFSCCPQFLFSWKQCFVRSFVLKMFAAFLRSCCGAALY